MINLNIPRGWLNAIEHIALGEGHDTLVIRSGNARLDTGDYPLYSGIDVLDITASRSKADLVITNAFVGQSDNQALTIKYSGDIKSLDTSDVNSDTSAVLLSGDGDVALSGKDDAVTVANGTTGNIQGMDGDDLLFGSDGTDFLFGGDGNDLLAGGPGDDHLSGGPGTDIFRYDGLQDGHDTVIDFDNADAINIGRLLEVNGLAFKSATDAQNDGNIQLTQDGANTVIAFDADGTAGDAHSPVAFMTLQNTQTAEVNLAPEF